MKFLIDGYGPQTAWQKEQEAKDILIELGLEFGTVTGTLPFVEFLNFLKNEEKLKNAMSKLKANYFGDQ